MTCMEFNKFNSSKDITFDVVQYLGSQNGVQDIVLEEKQPAARHELFLWEQKTFCSLPDDMRSFYLASNGFNLTWSTKIDTTVIPVGKMWLNTIKNVTRVGGISNTKSGPSLADLESDSDSDFDDHKMDAILDRRQKRTPSFNFHKSHLFELDPCDGVGKVCMVYQHHEHNSKPEIWFLDRALRWHYLAESFSSYYRLMLMNLGLPQWPYSFTDIGLSSQAKQWFHIYAPTRLELNRDLLSTQKCLSDPTEHNKLDHERLFQSNRTNRKKIAGSTSATTVTSTVHQTSTTSTSATYTTGSVNKKKPQPFAHKNTTQKFSGGSNTSITNRSAQMK